MRKIKVYIIAVLLLIFTVNIVYASSWKDKEVVNTAPIGRFTMQPRKTVKYDN